MKPAASLAFQRYIFLTGNSSFIWTCPEGLVARKPYPHFHPAVGVQQMSRAAPFSFPFSPVSLSLSLLPRALNSLSSLQDKVAMEPGAPKVAASFNRLAAAENQTPVQAAAVPRRPLQAPSWPDLCSTPSLSSGCVR